MEFKEKLQILRNRTKMSQEELAGQLNISRQSVTKWENGQTFPDIENLIQLSHIFNVSIDRLVKNNDECNIGLFKQQQFSEQDIRMFLIRAKNSTYISNNNIVLPSKANARDYQYAEGEYTYTDTYVGNEKFIGEEIVSLRDNPIYAMNYYGQILNQKKTFPWTRTLSKGRVCLLLSSKW